MSRSTISHRPSLSQEVSLVLGFMLQPNLPGSIKLVHHLLPQAVVIALVVERQPLCIPFRKRTCESSWAAASAILITGFIVLLIRSMLRSLADSSKNVLESFHISSLERSMTIRP